MRTAKSLFLCVVLLAILASSVGGCVPPSLLLRKPPAAPILPPQISQYQAHIAVIKDLDFEFLLPGSDQPRAMAGGEFIDFVPGALLHTGNGQSGFVFVGLPGRAELTIGPESEIKLISSDQTGVVVQLDTGRIILNLRSDFPEGRSVTALSAAGARTWINRGSVMCLSYQSSKELLRMDCVKGRCGYTDHSEKAVEAGYHVSFSGKAVTEVEPGLQPETCQFAPGAGPLSTATITPTQHSK